MAAALPFIHQVWAVLAELAPWLLLGAAVAGLLHVALPPGLINRQLNGRSGVFKAVALGVPMPLCSCGVIPTGIGLQKNGASNGAAVGFITATPQTGVDSILVSASFLGWPFALTKVVAAVVTGIASGLATDAAGGGTAPESSPHDSCAATPARGFTAFRDHALEMIEIIWGWLIVGILLSAALNTFLPEDFFTGIVATSTLATYGLVLVGSIPLYICATASVPIAASLVEAGIPTGAAMVFLMAGPATNVATLGAVYRAFGIRTVVVYLTTLIAGSVVFGLGYEAIFGTLPIGVVSLHDHTIPWWGHVSALLLTGLLAHFALQDLRSWQARRRADVHLADAAAPIVVQVGGMTCGGCTGKLERLLQSESDVDSAVVSLDEAQAKVIGAIERARVHEIIESAGFHVQG
jgi:hypothetical protein